MKNVFEIHNLEKKRNVLLISDLFSLNRGKVETFELICNDFEANYHFLLLLSKNENIDSIEELYQSLFIDGIPDYTLHISFIPIYQFERFVDSYICDNQIDFTADLTEIESLKNNIDYLGFWISQDLS